MQFQTVSSSELSVCGKPVALVPWPRKVSVAPGETVSFFDGTVVESDDVVEQPGFLALELSNELERATDGSWRAARGGWDGEVTLDIRPSLGEQTSLIDINDGSIAICGGDFAGLRYGVQTVRQLIRQCGGVLPVLHIEDSPTFKVRGYYLDTTRGRVPTLDWLKRWADMLEEEKYNQLQLYIEHSFAFPGLSEAWRGLDPLTPSEIMEFDRYCLERGIELVPSISTFGHLYVVLRTQSFRELGEFPEDADRPFSFIERQEHHTLNVALDKAFELSCSLIDHYLPLFTSKKFNICADETFDLGRGRSRASMGGKSESEMYSDYVNRLSAYISAKGHEPMMWADIALQHPDMLSRLDRKTTLLNWQYAPQVTDETMQTLEKAGARQYVCPAVQDWNQLLPSLHDAWENITKVARYGVECDAAGYLVTDWGDYGHVNDTWLSVPGMYYGAQCAWSGAGAGFDELNSRVERLVFGDTQPAVLNAWNESRLAASFTWADAIDFLELDYGDGTLNKDVQHIFDDIVDAKRQAVADAPDVAGARKNFLITLQERLRQVPGKQRALEGVQKALSVADVDVAHRPIARVLLRMAQGQDLFDACGWRLAADCGLLEDDARMERPEALAADLERWFECYLALWRETSKESEVKKVGGVVWRLADLLRGAAKRS
ncbi:family 20 glycosylhydrolase [Bifidobacterium sp. ESL0690]|uniref:beta-N-acetylhexosaminidase n=1 Tax=Bifidobacterium sp. ESL0690 TaxID=2983214 RepID=UPI0023F9F268|nr:family 20 glycosylhydrolase [Bifidobacterium sp. ESL0690]WEV46200.1 family 20 glycosylhydrolase [Bifidobacterium sp. ESL0690]